MKTYSKNQQLQDQDQVWESFVEYLTQVYFEDAEEILDSETIAFEFEQFIENMK